MIVGFFILAFGLWALCAMITLIGPKATHVILLVGVVAFILAVVWAAYSQLGGVTGVLTALVSLFLIAVYILNDLSKSK
jgi:hypothetical protein